MNEQETKQQTEAASERCLCRETLEHLQECLGISPTVRQHLSNSRIEFLKAIRAAIDARIEHMSEAGQRGTRVTVE